MSAQGLLNSVFSCSSSGNSKTLSKRKLQQTRSLDSALTWTCGSPPRGHPTAAPRFFCRTSSSTSGFNSSPDTPDCPSADPRLSSASLSAFSDASSISSGKRDLSPSISGSSNIFSPRKWLQRRLPQSDAVSHNICKSENSAVSHTSGHHKTEVQVIWVAPPDSPSSVQFLLTVAQGMHDYWVKIPGPLVSQNGVAPSSQTTLGGSIQSETTTSSILSRPFTSEGCGIEKSCLRDPEGCEPQNDAACHFLSFRAEGNSVMFELSGPAEGYVSFALSLDKWMGNDDVYLCIRDSDRVDIKAAYVVGRTHPQISSQNVLKDRAWRLSDGVIQCSFRREVHQPPEDLNRFSLDQMYYLFMAHGRADDGRTHRHDRQPLISASQTDMTGSPKEIGGSRSPLLIKFHGALMLIAWTSTVSAGVIMARYFKPDWPEQNILGQKVWFQLHRILMSLTVLLTLVAFVLPFIYRGGWSKRAGIHPYLGCVVMALTLIQPVMALFRPAPDAARRYIFNWMHFGTGTAAQIVAVVTVFLGIHQQALFLPSPWATGLLAFTVIWFVLADLVLEIHRRGFLPVGQ